MQIFTANDVAEILKVSKKTVWQLLTDGELKYFFVGKSKRIAEQDLEKYIRESRDQCQWINKKMDNTIGMISSSKVVGFQDRLTKRRGAKP
ncbi:MAG: hypothetical protein CL885_01235 [Dehalococcoidia bacterium]|nr:hypothetical protein [Dehalococcoidia bacterium]